MIEFIYSTLRSGLRGRSFWLIFFFGVCLVGVAFLAASFSPRQPKTVALDVGFSGIRFGAVLLALFWTQELLAREIERRNVIFSLTYPVSRAVYLLGRYCGILILLACAVTVLALLLQLAVLAAGGEFEQQFPVSLGVPYWLAILGIWIDVAVVAAFALVMASISTTPMLPLALGLAFAVAGRAFGSVKEYVAHGAGGEQALVGTYRPLLDLVGWVVPDLSRLDWRAWSMYGLQPDASIEWSGAMALVYVAILLMLAIRAFSRREFS